MPDGISSSTNGSSLQQQEMSLIHDRNLPSSPNPLYSPHSKTTGFMKAGIGQPAIRKQLMGGHAVVDNSRGLIQWVHSISFVAVSMEHSLQLLLQADSASPGKISCQYLIHTLFSSINVLWLNFLFRLIVVNYYLFPSFCLCFEEFHTSCCFIQIHNKYFKGYNIKLL